MLGAAESFPLQRRGLGRVEHLAQSEHDRAALGAQVTQCREELAVDPERVPVDDEQIGAECGERGPRGRCAQRAEVLGVTAHPARDRAAGASGQTGQDEPVPAVGQRVATGVRVTGDEQPPNRPTEPVGQVLGEGVRERPVAASVPESHRVVGVERNGRLHRVLLD